MMLKLLLLVSLLVITDAGRIHSRIINRVIHIESMLTRGRWLVDNSYRDADGSYYLYVDQVSERNTYYSPKTQFKVTKCGGNYVCLESVHRPEYYLTAGYPSNSHKHTVKLYYSTYVENEINSHWKIDCDKEDVLESCIFRPRRWENEKDWFMITDSWGGSGHNGGHFDGTLSDNKKSYIYWRILAPQPSDYFKAIYVNTNEGTVDQNVEHEVSWGVTETHETSETFATTTSMEIGGAFKAVSASASEEISNSWQTTDSKTYSQAISIKHKLTLPARCKFTLEQFTGSYSDQFQVGDQIYKEVVEDLDTKSLRTRYIKGNLSGEQEKKEEL